MVSTDPTWRDSVRVLQLELVTQGQIAELGHPDDNVE